MYGAEGLQRYLHMRCKFGSYEYVNDNYKTKKVGKSYNKNIRGKKTTQDIPLKSHSTQGMSKGKQAKKKTQKSFSLPFERKDSGVFTLLPDQ